MKKKRIGLYLIILLIVLMVFLGVYFVKNKYKVNCKKVIILL